MTIIEICYKILAEHQAYSIEHETWRSQGFRSYHIEKVPSRAAIAIIDVQTANAIRLCYETLKPDNQKKFLNLDWDLLIDWCWKQVR